MASNLFKVIGCHRTRPQCFHILSNSYHIVSKKAAAFKSGLQEE